VVGGRACDEGEPKGQESVRIANLTGGNLIWVLTHRAATIDVQSDGVTIESLSG